MNFKIFFQALDRYPHDLPALFKYVSDRGYNEDEKKMCQIYLIVMDEYQRRLEQKRLKAIPDNEI